MGGRRTASDVTCNAQVSLSGLTLLLSSSTCTRLRLQGARGEEGRGREGERDVKKEGYRSRRGGVEKRVREGEKERGRRKGDTQF